MKRSKVVVQPTLPGLAETAEHRTGGRRRPATRVWHDPAVVAARVEADDRYQDWRRSFAGFLAALPPRRRAELRRRLGPPAGHERVA
jgi:hypothetical protein